MSENIIAKGIALKLLEDVTQYEREEIDEKANAAGYTLYFGEDLVACYENIITYENSAGITEVVSDSELFNELKKACELVELSVELEHPKYFIDVYYNGVDVSAVYSKWDDIK